MKKHVTTRWLSLFPAINRIIDNIIPLKAYFVGLGTEDCPPIINQFVWTMVANRPGTSNPVPCPGEEVNGTLNCPGI